MRFPNSVMLSRCCRVLSKCAKVWPHLIHQSALNFSTGSRGNRFKIQNTRVYYAILIDEKIDKKNIIYNFFSLFIDAINVEYINAQNKNRLAYGIGRDYILIIFIKIRFIRLYGYFWAYWLWNYRIVYYVQLSFMSGNIIHDWRYISPAQSSLEKISMPWRSPTSNRAVAKDNAQYRNCISFPTKTLCGWN